MSKPLSDSAKRMLAYLTERFGDGFTGTIRIEAQDGGVRDLREEVQPLRDTREVAREKRKG